MGNDILHLDRRAGYDLWSRIYDDESNPLITLEETLVRSWFPQPAGMRVADVGCGTGRHSAWLAAAGAVVQGYDGSEGMREKARRRLAGTTAVVHELHLPAPLPVVDGHFDSVLFALVADHVCDLEPVFRELNRIVRVDGEVVFTVMHPAMNLKGISARFSHPESGQEVRVAAHEHRYCDYIMAVLNSGLAIAELVERCADEELVSKAPRAEKYLGWPMLLAMRLRKCSA